MIQKAPYDGFDESDDTKEKAKNGFLEKCYQAKL